MTKTATPEMIEHIARALALDMYPDTRWPKDEEDADYGVADREGRHPVSWHFVQKCRSQARVALAASQAVEPVAVPDGWKLVPIQPTEEMECAVDHENCATPDAAKAAYREMLAAAPPSPLDLITVSVIQPEFCGCMAGPNDPDPDCDQCKGTGKTSINSTAPPSTAHPEDFTADVWQQHKELIEEAGKLREEKQQRDRAYQGMMDEVEGLTGALHAAEARAATLSAENERLKQHIEELQDEAGGNCACSYDEPGDVCMAHSPAVKRLSAENAALAERLERVDGLVTRAKSIVPRWYEDWHACAEPPSHGRGSE